MSKQIILILIFVSFLVNTLVAQKKASTVSIVQGVEYYNNGDIKDGIQFFSGLIQKDSANAEHLYWLGKCYEETAAKEKALYAYLKAHKLNPKIASDILYRIGMAYQQNLFFVEAVKYFKLYKKEVTQQGAIQINSTEQNEHIKAAKRIHECENGKIIVAHPFDHKIYHLSGIINTEFAEYTPSVTADNNKIVFTSRRPGGTSDKKDKDNSYFEDVWCSYRIDGEWIAPMNLGEPVNTESHDAGVAMDAYGNELFLYRTTNGGDIYFSEFIYGQWTKPNPLDVVNSKYKEPSVCISANGRTIFFSSNRPGGYGGLDIYRVDKDKEGNWGAPNNMGSVVNSEYDEDSPFISPDGKTLYFSSNGHNNMGGYDIFSVSYDVKKKIWCNPMNLGFPINSADDDIYFAISGDHQTAYYASAKKDGFGEKDLYMIIIDTTYITTPLLTVAMGTPAPAHVPIIHPSTLKMHEGQAPKSMFRNKYAKPNPKDVKPPDPVPKDVIEYKGKVLDEDQKPIESNIKVKKEHSEETIKEYHTQKDGSFSIPLQLGFQYGIDIEKDGYVFASNNIDLSKTLIASAAPVMEEKIVLKKPVAGTKIVLKNIFYNTGNASLEMDSFSEIDILYDFMVKNPTLKIEISGHTDNKGSAEVNKELSTGRARAIYKLLVKKGIDPERVKFIGHGAEKPVASNDTEAGRRQNRRTEFEIIY